jgi:hypothetical protein
MIYSKYFDFVLCSNSKRTTCFSVNCSKYDNGCVKVKARYPTHPDCDVYIRSMLKGRALDLQGWPYKLEYWKEHLKAKVR